MKRAKSFIGFGLNVGVMGILTIVSIPIMIAVGGVSDWAAVAYGQSIGVIASVVIGYGWGISGPIDVARSGPEEHWRLYYDSVRARGVLTLPVMAVTTAICLLVPTSNPALCMLGGASSAVLGFRANWFFVGLRRPYVMLVTETLPRSACIITGLWATAALDDMSLAVWSQVFGSIAAVLVSSIWIRRSTRTAASGSFAQFIPVLCLLRDHRHGLSASLISSLFSNAPLLLVGFVSPVALEPFAVIDRVNKQLNTAVSPMFDVLRGWVPKGDQKEVRRRGRLAIAYTAGASGFLALVLYVSGPALVGYLSHGSVIPDSITSLIFGLMFGLAILSMVQGQIVLVSHGLIRQLSRNITLSSVISLPCIAVLSSLAGVNGALLGIISGRLVLVWLNRRASRHGRHRKS